MLRRIVLISLIFALAPCSPLRGDEFVSPIRPYDGIQAGIDAHRVGEARRLDAINRQLGWNELFKWQAATARPSTIFYDPYIPGYNAGFGYGGWYPSALDYRPLWGYGYFEAVRQPIGRSEVQTGPNRWESFPIYADDLTPRAVDRPAPAPVAPTEPAPPPAPQPPRGREF